MFLNQVPHRPIEKYGRAAFCAARARPPSYFRPLLPFPPSSCPQAPLIAIHPPHRNVTSTAPGLVSVPKAVGWEAARSLRRRFGADADGEATGTSSSAPASASAAASAASAAAPAGTRGRLRGRAIGKKSARAPSSGAASPAPAAGAPVVPPKAASAAAAPATTTSSSSSGPSSAPSAGAVVPRALKAAGPKKPRKVFASKRRLTARQLLARAQSRRTYRLTLPTSDPGTLFAVVGLAGRQYKVAVGDVINAEKLPNTPVTTRLHIAPALVGSVGRTLVGRPVVQGSTVVLAVESHEMDRKVIVFKKRRRKRYQKTEGFRREVTRLRVEAIHCNMDAYQQ
jgi:large subunit ribosomal protein L21